jgi:RNA polymerase subunit RPABC4/transcription elongation factor Spt4
MIYCPRCEPEKTQTGWYALLCALCTEISERANKATISVATLSTAAVGPEILSSK